MSRPPSRPVKNSRQRDLEADLLDVRIELDGVRAQLHNEIADLVWNMDLAVQYMRVFAEKLGVDEKLTELNKMAADRLEARRARAETP